MFTGYKFRVSAASRSLAKPIAFDQLVRAFATGGHEIATTARDAGVITAVTSPTLNSPGRKSTLNAVVSEEDMRGGVRVEVTLALPPGSIALVSDDTVREQLCRLVLQALAGPRK